MRNILKQKAIFLFAMAATATGAVALSDIPVVGSEEWRDMFAVDPADSYIPTKPEVDLADATTLSVTYKGKLAGFDIGRIWVDSQLTDEAYRITYKMEQKGIARWFSNAENTSEAYGLLGEDKNTSLYYFSYDYEGDDDYQYLEVTRQAPDSRFRVYAEPSYDYHHPVSFDQARDTLDPVSALVELGFLKTEPGKSPCDRTVQVFDGKRRFDLRMEDDGIVTLSNNGKGRYNGPAYRCRAHQDKIAGYRPKDYDQEIKGEAFVYLAQVPATVARDSLTYIPVFLEARGGIARATLEAKNPIITAPDGTSVNMGEM